ncbi:MAG TPA: serine hydrolase domain-containing protein, partial [Candidatus Baltobacteraceae bacterium]|nr:serine hydrolase domain-containing protein [Candidatus Baltobacteraceae bacterium]
MAAVIGLSHLQTAAIDSIVTSVMRSHDVTGLSLGIARKDSTLYLRGYGWRDASRMHRVDGYTIYPIGSLTKQFTAALILQQIADGRLALDAGRPTVRQLMNQTVGGRWQYRNANYAALGSALERTTATPFCRLLATRIAAPLHLASTSCGIPAGAWNVADGSIAAAHYLAPAAGGLASNARDLLHWLDDLSTGRVVTPRYFTAMTSSGFADGGVPTNYGFGFFIDDWYGYRVAEHSGYVDGYSSADTLVLDDGLEIAALSNADRVDLVPLLKSIAAIVDRPLDANLSAT